MIAVSLLILLVLIQSKSLISFLFSFTLLIISSFGLESLGVTIIGTRVSSSGSFSTPFLFATKQRCVMPPPRTPSELGNTTFAYASISFTSLLTPKLSSCGRFPAASFEK